jgi:hypothetical protein
LFNSLKRGIAVIAASSSDLLCAGQPARAQINPYFQIRPGITTAQYAYNMGLISQALSQFPQWYFGPRFANFGLIGATAVNFQ